MRKVRVNASYTYQPCALDLIDSALLGGRVASLELVGERVKVINKFGCPRANTMGQCYIEKDGEFLGMVAVGSLIQ